MGVQWIEEELQKYIWTTRKRLQSGGQGRQHKAKPTEQIRRHIRESYKLQ